MQNLDIIFLDIDGVLNSIKTNIELDFDEKNIIILKKIIEMTQAKIVLASSWIVYWDKDDIGKQKHPNGSLIDDICSKYDFEIYDKIPYMSHERGTEIKEWIRNHNVNHWVVINDEIYDDFKEEKFLNHVVKTCYYNNGLEEIHINKILKILSSTEEELKDITIKACPMKECIHRNTKVCDTYLDY